MPVVWVRYYARPRIAQTHVAELSDLVVGLALGIEIAPALAASHHQTGERVLERLLEPEELEDGEVDRGVEAQTALVWAECRVELRVV
jgi:hypothetical protein